MPLGFFSGNSGKAQPLPSGSADEKKDKKDRKDPDKDSRGVVLRLNSRDVAIERKLAEGGFAIVYLVQDRNNRQFALKRQFINDDAKQVEACVREYKIIKELKGHKNIVCYVDHLLAQNRVGIYDYMLLTVYYKSSVLQLMNDRLAQGQSLCPTEVLAIFCDMCEAVGRLHHAKTPVIHRDLKVENILIDERNRAAPPIYVLCDFGSATTKVVSTDTQPAYQILEDIERYTTLAYRAPEMIDIYEGKSIGTKVDMWALGVMLYKLCYFALPFGESAMAIQNGSYAFPALPDYPSSVKAVIHCLLDANISRRLTIYECASLAFQASGKVSPLEDSFGDGELTLAEAIDALIEGRPRELKRPSTDHRDRDEAPRQQPQRRTPPTAELCSTATTPQTLPKGVDATTTSVNPRLRPKPTTSVPSVPVISGPAAKLTRPIPLQIGSVELASDEQPNSEARMTVSSDAGSSQLTSSSDAAASGPLSCPLLKPADLGFTDLDETLLRDRAATEVGVRRSPSNVAAGEKTSDRDFVTVVGTEATHASLPSVASTSYQQYQHQQQQPQQQHRRNASDTSSASQMRSAFKPYSQMAGSGSPPRTRMDDALWNPFDSAPYPRGGVDGQPAMDDTRFFEYFDKLARNPGMTRRGNDDDDCDDGDEDEDASSIDSRDPFGAAPFDPPPHKPRTEDVRVPDETNVDGRKTGADEDSELDEQRMKARRRFSYENIDGVGDDASSDSRGRTDHDSTDETSRNGDTSHDEDAESSQHTDVAGSDDGGGSRPLLEDDGLEDDDEHELLQGYHCVQISDVRGPLFVDAGHRQHTNPFLRASDETPKMLSPVALTSVVPTATSPTFMPVWNDEDSTDYGRWAERRETVFERPCAASSTKTEAFAPATLPRQSTPLAATPRKPDLPLTAPVSTFIKPATVTSSVVVQHPSHLKHTHPTSPPAAPVVALPVPVPAVGTLIQVGTPTVIETHPVAFMPLIGQTPNQLNNATGMGQGQTKSSTAALTAVSTTSTCISKTTISKKDAVKTTEALRKTSVPTFIEGPKTPKPTKSKTSKEPKKWRKDGAMSSGGSDLETDGSEVEMFTSTSSDKSTSVLKKKKKPSAFALRSSHPSVVVAVGDVPLTAPVAPPVVKKASKDKKSAKRASTGALNASFVNNSFQAEDVDSPPFAHRL